MVQLGPLRQEWRTLLDDEFQQSYLSELSLFLRSEAAAGKELYPAESEYFASLNATPPDAVKVVGARAGSLSGSRPSARAEFLDQGRGATAAFSA